MLRRLGVTAIVLVCSVVAATVVAVPAWTAQASNDQRSAIEALDGLNSAVSVGVAYASYSERVVNAKIVVDRFTRTCPRVLKPHSPCDLVTKAMAAYVLAKQLWGKEIADPDKKFIDRSEVGVTFDSRAPEGVPTTS